MHSSKLPLPNRHYANNIGYDLELPNEKNPVEPCSWTGGNFPQHSSPNNQPSQDIGSAAVSDERTLPSGTLTPAQLAGSLIAGGFPVTIETTELNVGSNPPLS